ncbi:MAG: hypothetical protein B7Z75_07710 [Acidocella sp. 20-57-95]|nr:MAG: hypothetical protein B7Z75_07710 [Acidocella sp. 20-57-95]OYV58413.1 MAG: hypothetical protein B7Z71_10290 [Acidocella sp. 21-58-7]HQT62902.1 DUF4089 domain-containing protein [Acidocella sp.]
MRQDDIAAYLNAASQFLDLPIHPEHYEDVLTAFAVICSHAKHVMEFTLPVEIEAAPRFTP